MGNSLMVGGAMLGMDVRLVGAEDALAGPGAGRQGQRASPQTSGARVTLTDDVEEGVKGADFLYTDVWVSMGEPHEVWAERIKVLKPYQVNAAAMAATGNPDTKFMHCLPAFHNRETKVGEEMFEQYGIDGDGGHRRGLRVAASIVFDQAENRMHTIKAILVATMATDGTPRDADRRRAGRQRAAPSAASR